jgi:hypothetical protein
MFSVTCKSNTSHTYSEIHHRTCAWLGLLPTKEDNCPLGCCTMVL